MRKHEKKCRVYKRKKFFRSIGAEEIFSDTESEGCEPPIFVEGATKTLFTKFSDNL